MPLASDEELVERLSEGDQSALDELYRRYASKLYVFCHRAMGCPQAEDIVHDTFIRVIEASGQFDGRRAAFGAWVFKIARNRCVDLARRAKRIGSVSLESKGGNANQEDADVLREVIGEGGNDVAEAHETLSATEAVRGCIGDLRSDEQRQVIVLFYMGQMVFREIGEVIGKSTSMAQKILKQARENIKRCLERKGIEQASFARA